MTNEERIRKMRHEELLKFLEMIWYNGRFGLSPTYGWDEWLNREADDDLS